MRHRFIHYKLDLPVFDTEHFALFKAMYECVRLIRHKEDITAALHKLYLLMVAHTEHEETFLLDNDYPYFMDHKYSHDCILSRLSELIKTKATYMTEGLCHELDRLIVSHIDHYDLMFKDYYKDRRLDTLIFK